MQIMKIPALLIIAMLFLSCEKEENKPSGPAGESLKGVFVLNEGSFMGANAGVSFFSDDGSLSSTDIYSQVNSLPLGDVALTMTMDAGSAYIVVNNSQKVEIVNRNTFRKTGTINGFTSPRYFLKINNNTGYVSDWSDNNIKIVDLVSNTITGTIPAGNGPEQMVEVHGTVFVCNIGGFSTDSTITIINPSTHTVDTTITVGTNPANIQVDKDDNIWVLCGGSYGADWTPGTADDISARLVQLDHHTYSVIQQFDFPQYSQALRLVMNGTRDKMYFLGGLFEGPVYSMGIYDLALPSTPLINRNFYGIGIDPVNGEIYGGLPGFTISSKMIRHNGNGLPLDSATVGIAPNGFYFNK